MKIDVLLALMIIGSFLAAIVLHECAHALAALWLGDRTPSNDGRLTLRLRPHLDSVGTVLCVIMAFQPVLTPPVGLGWGKPVKADPWKLRPGTDRGVFLVALAGPIASLLIGLLIGLLLRFVGPFLFIDNPLTLRILQLLVVFANVNIALALFNLIPLYPLDGYQMLYSLLPSKQAVQFARSAAYGPFIILILFFFLPFLAQLSNLGSFPLFRLAYYLWLGALSLMALVSGLGINFQSSLAVLQNLYLMLP
jgi:Zn-dependent protease